MLSHDVAVKRKTSARATRPPDEQLQRLSGLVSHILALRAGMEPANHRQPGFTDITVGEGIQGGYGYAVYTDKSTEHFLFGGVGEDVIVQKASVSLYASHVSGDSLFHNQIGINIDAGVGGPVGLGGGFGLGVNTDSLTSCVDNHFH